MSLMKRFVDAWSVLIGKTVLEDTNYDNSSSTIIHTPMGRFVSPRYSDPRGIFLGLLYEAHRPYLTPEEAMDTASRLSELIGFPDPVFQVTEDAKLTGIPGVNYELVVDDRVNEYLVISAKKIVDCCNSISENNPAWPLRLPANAKEDIFNSLDKNFVAYQRKHWSPGYSRGGSSC